ncbi:MAG: VCBS repeat-containing protein [Chitinophagaceae bacterium]|nr:VCBS repeat-containing protein [Chitinophagaceae bacterium]
MTILLSMKLICCIALLPILLVPLLVGCKKAEVVPVLFNLVENSGIDFTNNIANTRDFNIFSYRNFYNGGGVGIGDVNNDGLPDVFFTANMGSNKLYLNKGNLSFEDITKKGGMDYTAKWSTGVVMADVNADGWLDIYVCNAGFVNGQAPESKLYINNHDLTFTDSAKQYGLANTGGYATHAAFFDYDNDGDLDCFIINNSFIPVNTLDYANKRNLRSKDWPVADFLKGGGDYLYRNDNMKFVDVSKEAGVHGSLISFGLGISVGDVNGDHYPDVYVSNDFFERDYLYINQKDGTFKDELEERMQHTSLASMGSDIADINNDGYPDIFTTDMLPADDYRLRTTTSFDNFDVYRLKERSGFYHQFQQNALQVNNQDGTFSDVAAFSGVAASDWSWGALFFDADNDGFNDIYVCNGIKQDVTDQDFIDFFSNNILQKMALTGKKEEIENIISKMPSNPLVNKAYKNLGNLKFADNGTNWGFTQASFSNGASYADLDNDGDLDLVVNIVNQKAFLYRNNSRQINRNNFIAISLKGNNSNTFAIGALIKVYAAPQVFSSEIMPSRGFQSSVDYTKIIGLGNVAKVDSVVITWPNHSNSTLFNPVVNQKHFIKEPVNDVPVYEAETSRAVPVLQALPNIFEKHREDDYVDYYYERNIPGLLSAEGPKAAGGDVNGDGLEDIFVGGAAGQAGQLYLQTANGFIKKYIPDVSLNAAAEDVPVLFFDCDGDADPDLLIGPGGNNGMLTNTTSAARLYLNDGRGNFKLSKSAIPNSRMNSGVLLAFDFDNDGDLDVFSGSRSVPQNYGLSPETYIYVNDGKGHFANLSAGQKGEITNIGMVTGAVWADIIGDKRPELTIVGEWMAPRIFSYNANKFVELKSNLNNLFGWWQCVSASDLDGDGKMDLVLGNMGENFYLHPDFNNPVKLWISDFDNDFMPDKVLSRTINKRDMPVFLKREMVEQFPGLKKQNLHYLDFAKKSVSELFSAESIKNSEVKIFNYASSCIAYNSGNLQFLIEKLPVRLQLSSLNVAHCIDLNNDGKIDIISGGNQFGFPPQFGRLDASCGDILMNTGKRTFEWLGSKKSGLALHGVIRDIVEVKSKQDKKILILQNNAAPVLYKINNKSNRSALSKKN